MKERRVRHATFVIERSYSASPSRVFAAFANAKEKAAWFGDPDHPAQNFTMDFRVGGRETNAGGSPGGPVYSYEALYHDIVPNQRIVTSYAMQMDATPISASVATTEFKPDGNGTRLVYTEQGAFLDDLDTPEIREGGVAELLGSLETYLERDAAMSR